MFKKAILSLTLLTTSQLAMADWALCTVAEVGQFGNRIYISCKQTSKDSAGASVNVFIVPLGATTAEINKANRFFAIGQAAAVSGKNLGMYYQASGTSTTYNCSGTCRMVDEFNLYTN